MKELVHKKKGYKGISDHDRNRLLKEAVDIVRRRFSYGVAVTVDIKEYESQAPMHVRGMGSAYSFLCHLAMTAMSRMAEIHDDPGPITYVFEAGQEHEADARFAVKQVTTVPELKKLYRHSGDAFLPKADAVPLQAADLLAWEVAKFKDETVDHSIRDIRHSLRALLTTDTKRYHIAFCGGQSLKNNLTRVWQLVVSQMEEDFVNKARKFQ